MAYKINPHLSHNLHLHLSPSQSLTRIYIHCFHLSCVFSLCNMDPNEAYKNALLNIDSSKNVNRNETNQNTTETAFPLNHSEIINNLPNPIHSYNSDPDVQITNLLTIPGYEMPTPPNFSTPFSMPTVIALESKLAEFSLLARFVQGPVDLRQVMGKFKQEWKNLKGQFLCDDMGNDWFIIKFANKEDRNLIWENRPYHVQSNLLALYQWNDTFDPTMHDTTTVDLWLRIPGVPHQLLTPNAIELILRENGVGRLIRLDPTSNIRNKLRFVRCCVSVDLTSPLVCSVNILKPNGNLVSLRVWYEDFSEGCGCCGGSDHTYDDCPLNKPQPRKFKVILDEKPFNDALLNNRNNPSSPTGPLSPTPHSQNPSMSEHNPNSPIPTIPSTEPSSSTNPPNLPNLVNQIPLNCLPQMINPELYKQLLAMHNSNPNLPHPLENITIPITRPLSPKAHNATITAPPDCTLAAVVSQHLNQGDTSENSNNIPSNSIKSDSTIVKKLEGVDIKQADQNSNDSDATKRKEDQDSKEISSPSTKRLRKKKN